MGVVQTVRRTAMPDFKAMHAQEEERQRKRKMASRKVTKTREFSFSTTTR